MYEAREAGPSQLDRPRGKGTLATIVLAALLAVPLDGAFLFEIDLDGADDGAVFFNPRFSFGGDTTSAGSSGPCSAFAASGADSIFGGDGAAQPDTYVYRYAPDTEPDNLALAPGAGLGEGNGATGEVGGGPGVYAVYATWPFTTNVSGGPTRYRVKTNGEGLIVDIDQNDADGIGTDGRGDVWVLLGYINYTSGDITVHQQPTVVNSFVSQRACGLLFERDSASVLFVDSFESGDTVWWSSSEGE